MIHALQLEILLFWTGRWPGFFLLILFFRKARFFIHSIGCEIATEIAL